MSRRRSASLSTRITGLCLLVAVVTVVVAGIVAGNLIADTATEVNRQALSDQADGVVDLVRAEDHERPLLGIPRVVQVLRGQDVSIVVRYPDGSYAQSAGTARTAAEKAGLDDVTVKRAKSELVTVDDRELLVEARGLEPGLSFALVRPVHSGEGFGAGLLGNVLVALSVGLGVAVVAGPLLSALLSRSLRATAKVAMAMRQGRRDVRAPVGGAAEVDEVARSVNELADALRHSESRQRDFLLSVSHELRTPLTSIKGFAESLSDGVVDGADTRAVGATMLGEADRLERLVTDLLDLARIGADEFTLDVTAIDAVALVDGTAESWRRRFAERGVDFRVETAATPVIHADPRRLRQVLDVLLDNAWRLTPAGAPVVLALSAHDEAVTFAVRDGGPGLSPDDYAVAFERGILHGRYRGRRQGGSGVGLALAHRLTTRMGGELSAGPAAEGGAAFTVAFAASRSLHDSNLTPTGREHPCRTVERRHWRCGRKGRHRCDCAQG